MEPEYLVVVSEQDPIAPRVDARWGTLPGTGVTVDGAAIRRLTPAAEVVRRPGLHIHDEHLDRRLPSRYRERRIPLVFPSIHRGESGVGCVTVHPLGNLREQNEFGGEARRLVPTAPRLMANALRRLAEAAAVVGTVATYEATHHGPALDLPAFFIEISDALSARDQETLVAAFGWILGDLAADPSDRVAVGVGGGHYVPHFTELALGRSWAFGHLIPRHALDELNPTIAAAAWTGTPGADGVLFQRAADVDRPEWRNLGRRLRDGDAPIRIRRGVSRASGT